MPSPARLTLIVSTHDDGPALAYGLRRIAAQTVQPQEIIIAEDGENPATAAVIAAARATLAAPIVHLTQPHAGFRKARILNAAIARATGEYVVFLDGDCIAHPRFLEDHAAMANPGWFVQGRRAFVKEEAVPACIAGRSPLALLFTGGLQGVFKAFRFPFSRLREDSTLHGVLGCNLSAWRDDLFAINGYDEGFEGWGREDSDLAARLYHLGRRRLVAHGRAVVYHLNHPPRPRTQLGDNERALQETLATRRVRCARGLAERAAATNG